MEMISLHQCISPYNGLKVINDVSHVFEKGSFTAILGPERVGKDNPDKAL